MRNQSCSGDVLVSKPVSSPFHENPNCYPLPVTCNNERRLVCVTSGTSYLGRYIVRKLLKRGFSVRLTVQNSGDFEEWKEIEDLKGRLESVVEARMDDLQSLCNAFCGCHAIFHTSSFIDPHGVSGYSKQMALLEAQGAENVIEACAMAAAMKRCVLTSSLLASIWQREINSLVDEHCWSDEEFCRDNKLWLALGKTMAEKSAWRLSEERQVKLVTVCPALITGPAFPRANSTASIGYVKGGRVMLERGVLASMDIDRVAEAHVRVYEEMDNGACGRYLCFERVICREDEAIELEHELNIHGQLSRTEEQVVQTPCVLVNAKLNKLISSASRHVSCK